MTKTLVSKWTPWYVDLQNTTKVQCLVCGEDFTKKNSRMLSHLGYIPSTGAQDSNVKLCKNVKPYVLHAFRECGGVAPTPPEPAESQHLQGKASNCGENKDVHKNIWCDACGGWLEFSQQPPSFKYDVLIPRVI
jgi:hypothetical protein